MLRYVYILLILLTAGCAYHYVGPITGKVYTTYAVIPLLKEPAYDREVRLANYLKHYPDTKPDLKQLMLDGKIHLGMTKEQVLVSRGYPPDDINRTVSASGSYEQWVYGDPLYGAEYLYFTNNILTSWQD